MRIETGVNVMTTPISKVKEILNVPAMIPDTDRWRLPLLVEYVQIRDELNTCCEDTKTIDELIDSLCSS